MKSISYVSITKEMRKRRYSKREKQSMLNNIVWHNIECNRQQKVECRSCYFKEIKWESSRNDIKDK